MQGFKPMLATAPGLDGVTVFPVLATPKIDGIRAVKIRGSLVSRTLKPIPNIALRTILESLLPEGTDGELTHGDTFQTSTSAIMSREGPTSGYTYYAFDWYSQSGYADRISRLAGLMSEASRTRRISAARSMVRVVVLTPTMIRDRAGLDAYERKVLDDGFEGVIVRKPDGQYKFGRSTVKEGLMLKVKRFEDAEARVTGVEELIHKDDEEGHSNLLGALVAVRPDGVIFRIGTGFSTEERRLMWRMNLIGRLVKYKFFGIGSDKKAAPRFPTFIGFRDENDMGG